MTEGDMPLAWELCVQFARALGLVSIFPPWRFVEGRAIRMGLAIALVMSSRLTEAQVPTATSILWGYLEGVVFAVPAALGIELMSGLGEIFDRYRGQNIAALNDIRYESEISALGSLVECLCWGLLLEAGILSQLVVEFRFQLSSLPAEGSSIEVLTEQLDRLMLLIGRGCYWTVAWGAGLLAANVAVEAVLALLGILLPGLLLQGESYLIKLGLMVAFLKSASLGDWVDRAFEVMSIGGSWS